MAKYIFEQDRANCIGCGACAAISPEYLEMNDDGKADIKEAKKKDAKGDHTERIIEDKDLDKVKEAAESCPVNILHLKKENGEKIV